MQVFFEDPRRRPVDDGRVLPGWALAVLLAGITVIALFGAAS